jgi:hypothetical protein
MVEPLITSATRDELVFVAHRDSPFTPHKEINRNAARDSAKKATTVRAAGECALTSG